MASNKEKLIAVAQKLVEKGQFDKAVKEYLKVVEEDDKDVRVWLKIGDLYVKLTKNKEAAEAYMRVAQFYSDQGFYLKAVAVYKQIIKIEPRLVEVNLRLADLYRQLGLVADAMAQFEQVAAFYQREGKNREALGVLKQIVELEPDNVASRIKLAELYSKEQMAAEAIAEFTRAATSLKQANRVDDYLKVAERLLFHEPGNRPLARELARMYIDKHDPRRALPKLQVLFKADPRDVETLALLASAFEGLEQIPKTVSVLRELARIHGENGDQQKREDAFRNILRVLPDDPEALAAIGRGRQAAPPRTEPLRAEPPPPTPQAMTSPPPQQQQQQQPRRPGPSSTMPAIPRSAAEAPRTVEPSRVATRSVPADASRPAEQAAIPLTRVIGSEASAAATTTFLPDEPESAAAAGSDDEEVARILTETEVYLKYGLHAKAIEHVNRILDRAPNHVEAHEKLATLYSHVDRQSDAVSEYWTLYGLTQGKPRSLDYLRSILKLAPDDQRAKKLLSEAPRPATARRGPVSVGTVVDVPRGSGGDPDGDSIEDDVVDLDDVEEEEASAERLVVSEEDEIPMVLEADSGDQTGLISEPIEDRFGVDMGEAEDDIGLLDDPDIASRRGTDHTSEFSPDLIETTETTDGDVDLLSDLPPPPASSLNDDDDAPRSAAAVLAHGKYDDREGRKATIDLRPTHTSSPSDRTASGAQPIPNLSPGGGGGESLEDSLDEADFFAAQGQHEEARALLQQLLERFPDHPLVHAKVQDLDGAEAAAAARRAAPKVATPVSPVTGSKKKPAPPSDYVVPDDTSQESFADLLHGDDQTRDDSTLPETGGEILPPSPSAVVAAPPEKEPPPQRKHVVEKGVSPEDFETHYDLGIAYREMGLLDDAIKEFKLVMQDPVREVQCHMMIGLCLMARNTFSDAISQFKKGLYASSIQEREELALYFELGQAYERLSDGREALYYYDKVSKRDPAFRDVERRIVALRTGSAAPSGGHGASGEDVDAALDGLLK